MKRRLCLMLCVGLLCLSPAVGGTEDAKPVDATRLTKKTKKKANVSKMTAKEKKAYVTAIKKEVKEKARNARRRAMREAQRKILKLQDANLEKQAANLEKQAANLEKQWKPQFQQLLNVELSFMQRVCPLTADQHKQISVAAVDCLKDALKKYTMAMAQAQARRGQRGDPDSDPRQLIQQGIFKIVKEKLGPEQAKRYQAENDKRAASQKNSAAQLLVAILDDKLILDVRQRDQLTKSLKSNWQETWGRSLESLMNNPQYFPTVDDEYVIPFLNEKQKIVWRGIQKVGFPRNQILHRNMAVIVDDFKLGVLPAGAAINAADDATPAGRKK